MTDQHLIDSVRRADPVGDLDRLPEPRHDALALLALADEERVTTTLPSHTTPPQAPRRRWLRPVAAFAVALVLGLGLIGMVALLGDGEPPIGDQTSTTTNPPETTTATPSAPAVLFIGNTEAFRSGGLDAHLEALAASGDPPLRITTRMEAIAPEGYSLQEHWEGGYARDVIRKGTWDVVVLQGHIQSEASVERFQETVREFVREIDATGARTVLYMTWERDLPDALLATTTEMIAEAHSQIATELDVDVAPAGLAWQRSIQERPELTLYETDRRHANEAGTYLTVCVLYATIFDQSPVGLTHQPADLYEGIEGLEWLAAKMQMTDDDLAFLQRIAWETVVDYQGQQG